MNPNKTIEEVMAEFANTFSIALRHMKIDDKSITDFLEQALHQAKEQGRREMKLGLREVAEIYIGMEGFIPQTAPEAYQQFKLKEMYDTVQGLLNR